MTTIATSLPALAPSSVPSVSRWRSLALVAAFSAFASFAQAGPVELKLLNTFLNGNVATTADLVSTASTADLVNAVKMVIAANPKYNAGTIAGEALKRAMSPDFGASLASTIIATYPATGNTTNGIPFGKKFLTLSAFATQAIITSATSTALNVTQVPTFSSPFAPSNNSAITLAVSLKKIKVAASAVIKGRALNLNESDKITLANSAIVNVGLAGVITDVVAGVSSTVADPIAFTDGVVLPANVTNNKYVLQIVTGITAGQPTSAGAIVEEAYSRYPRDVTAVIVKGAASLAATVGAVADIEQIQRVGLAIAQRVGTVGGTRASVIKLATFSGIATVLARAIVNKPLAVDGANRNANKVDELGELAAYSLNAISDNADFNLAPEKSIAALIKSIIAGSKSTYGPSQLDVASYVLGSVALTVANLPSMTTAQATLKSKLLTYLQLPTTAAALVGKGLATIAQQAIKDGVNNTPGKFENGTDAATGALTDAETNSRNL